MRSGRTRQAGSNGAVLGCLGSAAMIAVVSKFVPTPFSWAGFGLALVMAAIVIPVVALNRGTRHHADGSWLSRRCGDRG